MLSEKEEQIVVRAIKILKNEIEEALFPPVVEKLKILLWGFEKLIDTNDDCKAKDAEFKIVVSQYTTEILDLKKQLKKATEM